jgi:hypothetical protein
MKWLTPFQKTVLYAASERDSGQCGEIGRHAGFKINSVYVEFSLRLLVLLD